MLIVNLLIFWQKKKKLPTFHINMPQRRKKPDDKPQDDKEAVPGPSESKEKNHGRPVFEPFIDFVNRKLQKKSEPQITVDIGTEKPEDIEVEAPKVDLDIKPHDVDVEAPEVEVERPNVEIVVEKEAPELDVDQDVCIDVSIRETRDAMKDVEDQIKQVKLELKEAEQNVDVQKADPDEVSQVLHLLNEDVFFLN